MFFRRKKEIPEENLEQKMKWCRERVVILEAIVFASENHRDITKIIFESEDWKDAKEKLSEIYGFSEEQSQAIIDTRMKALTKSERKKLYEEFQIQ
jgi:DNA gyrase subunit A